MSFLLILIILLQPRGIDRSEGSRTAAGNLAAGGQGDGPPLQKVHRQRSCPVHGPHLPRRLGEVVI